MGWEYREEPIDTTECEHALVVESEYEDGSVRSEFCPKCETSLIYALGFFEGLTAEQQRQALAYRGEDV